MTVTLIDIHNTEFHLFTVVKLHNLLQGNNKKKKHFASDYV